LFPDKAKMVRSANALPVIFAIAPVLWLVTAFLVTYGKPGFLRDPSFIPNLFIGLALVSLANIGLTVFLQTSKKVMSARSSYDPVDRVFLKMVTGSILSEAHAIYGLVLTLLSGPILYELGFTVVTWASLWWVWKRFKQNITSLPNR
jgi:F0F1-type ATP synthase membrane subunit c/vacuolar-type H+-ATPase subunit K